MPSVYLDPATAVSPPGSGGTITIPASASSTAGSGNLSAYEGRWLSIRADVGCHVRFGTSSVGAATAGDWYLPADVGEPYRIPKSGTLSRVTVLGKGTAGKLYFRVTSGPV